MRILITLSLLFLALLPNSAVAEPLMTLAEVRRGTLMMHTDETGRYQAAAALDTQVNIHITGPIARSYLRQTFSNDSDDWLEATYAFPLPADAAVDRMRLLIGERIIEAEIQEKQEARRVYQAARQAGQRAALLEQHRPNLFTTAVANIAPHSRIVVEMEYQQNLLWENEEFSLRFPMAITPRYQPGGSGIEQRQEITQGWSILPGEIAQQADLNPATQNSHNPVSIHVKLNPGFDLAWVKSRHHPIVQNQENGLYQLELAGSHTASNQDFELHWKPQIDQEPQAAFFAENSQEGDYGLLMLMPPQQGFDQEHAQSRELILLIDTSGSMGGESIRAARESLLMALDTLQASDRFNVIQFNSYPTALFRQAQMASSARVQEARRWVRGLQADGGTEMAAALNLAFTEKAPDPSYLRQIVFITDGAVGNESQLFDLIRQKLGASRLFTVGIGSAPNMWFMQEAAIAGRGSSTSISHTAEARDKLQKLFSHLRHPALSDLTLDLPVAADMLPNPLPDLYRGQPVRVWMKLSGPTHRAQIEGRFGHAPWSTQLELKQASPQSGLRTAWAREQIATWQREQGHSHRRREDITHLALQHHLLSPYTSLVAVDKTPARTEEALHSRSLKSNLPLGMQAGSVALAKGSTASPLLWLLAVLCGLIAWGLRAGTAR